MTAKKKQAPKKEAPRSAAEEFRAASSNKAIGQEANPITIGFAGNGGSGPFPATNGAAGRAVGELRM